MDHTFDRFCRFPAVHHDALFGVMGIPLRFQTNSALIFTLAIDAFARFGPPKAEGPLLTMRLFLHHPDVSYPHQNWPVLTRSQGDYMYVTWGPANTVTADAAKGHMFGFISPDAPGWPHRMREVFVQMPVYFTLTRHEFVPLNVAILLWRRRYPLYLVSESADCLAHLLYRAVRSGWRLVAENMAMAVRTSRGWHFWGIPWWLHMPTSALHQYPELAAGNAYQEDDGAWYAIVDVEDMWPGSTEFHAGPGPLILVRHPRSTPHTGYDWMDPPELLAHVDLSPWLDEDWLHDRVADVTGYLAEKGTYWFQPGSDWDEVLTRLYELGERHWRL